MLKFECVFDEHYKSKNDLENVLLKLKEAGASQMDCVKLLITKTNLKLSEADQIVLYSKCWSDKKEKTFELRNSFFDALNNTDNDK